MKPSLRIIALLLVASSPAPLVAAPAKQLATASCRTVGHGEWSAHVNAMPGPRARRTLIVIGRIGVKPDARTRLRLAPEVMESHQPQYMVVSTSRSRGVRPSTCLSGGKCGVSGP